MDQQIISDLQNLGQNVDALANSNSRELIPNRMPQARAFDNFTNS